jgi:phosphatidylserine decarboxylase
LSRERRVPIAREGWPVIGTVTAVLGTVAVVGVFAGHPVAVLPLLLGLAFSLNFFRDPERLPPPEERFVVSPADGRVLHVTSVREEQFLGAPATRISIFMSPLDVHVNRSPVAGTVTLVRHTPGRFRAAFDDKASLDNERNAILVEGGGRRYLMVQIAGAIARRIRCHVQAGSRVERGGRVGMIMFGSRCDLYLPPDVRPTVARGDRLRAGASVVGEVPL